MLSIKQISARVESLKFRAAERDRRQQDVLAVRTGKISQVYPEFFPEGVDANVVTKRAAIVTEADRLETAITNAANVEALIEVLNAQNWGE